METRTYRASAAGYVVFGTLCAGIAALWLFAIRKSGASPFPAAIPLGAFAFVALWLSRFRLRVADDELLVATPFRAQRRVAMRDILTVEFATEWGIATSPFVLCIRTSAGEELRFNAKVFPSVAVQHLLALGAQGKSKSPR